MTLYAVLLYAKLCYKIKLHYKPIFSIRTLLSFLLIRIQAKLKTKTLFAPPPNLVLSLTSRCNKSCSFCHYLPELNQPDSSDLELDFYTFKKILNSSAAPRFGRICLYGGEPLLNKDFFKMVREIKERKYLVTAVTNGLLIHKYIEEFKLYPLDLLTVSYYPEDVDKIKESIKEISKVVPINISFVLDSESESELPNVLEYSKEIGATMVTIESLREVGFCDRKSLLNGSLKERKRESTKKYKKDFILRWSSFNEQQQTKSIKCIDLWDTVFVNTKGEVSPCCQYPLSSYEGSVTSKESSINSKTMIMLRDKFSKNVVPKNCENCHYLYERDPLYK